MTSAARACALAVLAALCVATAPAAAQESTGKSIVRTMVDRVDHEPSSLGGTRLTILLSALQLTGGVIPLEWKAIKAFAGSEIKAPHGVGRFGETDGPLAIVVVVQQTQDYAEVLPVIAETIEASLLSKLPEPRVQLAVLAYGDSPGTGKLGPFKTGRSKLAQLSTDGTAGDPALMETIDTALRLLKKAKTTPETRPIRKMILLIGDGRDRSGDRDRVTRTGVRAAKEGVRIHAFAFSPADQRRPHLLLGELAKRSLGTFRWIQNKGRADSWTNAFTQMAAEILDQYVVTYYLSPDEDPSGRKLRVETVGFVESTTADRQADLKVPTAECNDEPCGGYCVSERCVKPRGPEGRGIVGWIVLIGGIGLGAMLVLGLIGYALSKRSQSIPLPPGVTPEMIAAARAQVPGSVPPGAMPQAMAPQMPVANTGRPVPHLMFLSGPRTGERVPLRHGFLIGKAPNCDLVIEDGYTSTHHAQFTFEADGTCKVYDHGSTNGTFLNGVRITNATMEHGATLKVGSVDLRFLAQ